MLTKLFNFVGAETLKEKIIFTAEVVGVFMCCFAFLKLLQIFMWMCYYAGIPM